MVAIEPLEHLAKYKINKLSYRVFRVRKETEDDYNDNIVRWTDRGWKCTCSPYQCKHIFMVWVWGMTDQTREFYETKEGIEYGD